MSKNIFSDRDAQSKKFGGHRLKRHFGKLTSANSPVPWRAGLFFSPPDRGCHLPDCHTHFKTCSACSAIFSPTWGLYKWWPNHQLCWGQLVICNSHSWKLNKFIWQISEEPVKACIKRSVVIQDRKSRQVSSTNLLAGDLAGKSKSVLENGTHS